MNVRSHSRHLARGAPLMAWPFLRMRSLPHRRHVCTMVVESTRKHRPRFPGLQPRGKHYPVVFDVVQSGYRQWLFPAGGLFVIVLALRDLFVRRRFLTKIQLYAFRIGLGLSLPWMLLTFGLTFGDYKLLSSELRSGRCQVTEGIVTDFHPMPYTGLKTNGLWSTANGLNIQITKSLLGSNRPHHMVAPCIKASKYASIMSEMRSLD